MKTNKLLLLLTVLAASLFVSCRHESDTIIYCTTAKTTDYKIAVVLPLLESGEYNSHFESIIGYATTNMRNAQKYVYELGDSLAVDIKVEWYDEDSVQMDSLAQALAVREDLLLVLGPLRNGNVDIMANVFEPYGKTLIVPSASSESIIRRYAVTKSGDRAEKPFLWSLCETDVSQSKALLAKAWESGASSVALLTPDDEYGQTFFEWVPFFATEMDIELTTANILQYTDDLAVNAEKALSSGVDCVICAVNSAKDAQVVLEAKANLGDKTPRILFTNGALSDYLLQLGDLAEGAEGIAPYADPSTGFQVAYEERFGQSPGGAEVQVYDAMLLSGITAFIKNHYDASMDTNEIIRMITSLGDDPFPIWDELGLKTLMAIMKEGLPYVKLVGASGPLRFDSEACTTLVQSTYVHWMVYNGKILTLDYMSDDGSNRTASTLAAWNWKAKMMEDIEDQDTPVQYGPHGNSYALLIQGSSGWANYRHQADVLNVYQMLRRNGWDDDHIILIISDEIAGNEKNKFPGRVSTYTYGDNLYENAVIDYSIDSLSVNDIQDIMLGKSSDHLPTVLSTDDKTNVLMFWSGHGCLAATHKVNGFTWGGKEGLFSESDFRSTLEQMHSQGRYRKMLLLLEPCYSRNMARQADGIPGILAIASANGNESSFADFHSFELSVWMSDRFSNNLVTTLSEKPDQTYRELYEYLYTHTLGSHVYVENSYWFGNLCKTTLGEFTMAKN